MEDLKKIKKNIKEDWLDSFPDLYPFTLNKYYKIVGCCVMGIELVNVPNTGEYRPHFVMYPLWKANVKECLDAPYFYISLVDDKGLQFSVPYMKHEQYFKKSLENVKTQMPLLLTGDVNLNSLFQYVDSWFENIMIQASLISQTRICELEFYTALYIGNQNDTQDVLDVIRERSKKWNMTVFDIWNKNFDLWFENLKNMINQKDDYLQRIKFNQNDKKISSLKRFEIVI